MMNFNTGRTAMLVLFALIYAVNILDRQILGIALPQIRAEFHLSDSALGLLTGPAFALIYTLLGVPAAILSDHGHRRTIIAAALGIFSSMTLVCAAAGSFLQLLCARFGVGVGEAGTGPALQTMIAERYPPHQRTAALSAYAAGANLGLLMAFFGGGLIVQYWGWRPAMLAAGMPGLVLMAVFLLATRGDRPVKAAASASLVETTRFLLRRRSFRFIALACGLAAIGGYAGLAFAPSYLSRSHHLSPAQIGLALALFTGVIGFAGTMLPGLLADRYRPGKIDSGLRAAVLTILAAFPFQVMFYMSPNLALALAGLAVAAFFASSFMGPAFAAVQNIAPPGMRAKSAALLLVVLNLVGMGLGPLIVGIASDLLRTLAGEESLRYAMLVGPFTALGAAWCFWQASRTLHHELAET